MTPVEQYRKIAAELKARAAADTNERLAVEWANLARCYLRLAEQADQNSLADVWIEIGPPPSLDARKAKTSAHS